MDDYAIVQSPDFGTLFVLSREQNVTETKLDVSRRISKYIGAFKLTFCRL